MPARTPLQVGHGLSPLSLESPWGHAGYIARTIKSFEKALQPKALLSFGFLKIFISSPGSSPPIFAVGPSDHPKGPHLESRLARMTTSKRPFYKAIWAERHPHSRDGKPLLGGWGLLGSLELKKGKHLRASLANAKILHDLPECKCVAKTSDIKSIPRALFVLLKRSVRRGISPTTKGISLCLFRRNIFLCQPLWSNFAAESRTCLTIESLCNGQCLTPKTLRL